MAINAANDPPNVKISIIGHDPKSKINPAPVSCHTEPGAEARYWYHYVTNQQLTELQSLFSKQEIYQKWT